MLKKSPVTRQSEVNHLIDWYQSNSLYEGKTIELLDSFKSNCHTYNDHEFNNFINLFRKDVRLLFQWLPYIHEFGEYKYHMVLTFKFEVNANEANQYLNRLLHLLNSKFFSRSYVNKGKFLKGFSIREYHKNKRIHFHILIQDDDAFRELSKLSFDDHVKALSKKVVKNLFIDNYEKEKDINKTDAIKKYSVFDPAHVYIQEIYYQQGIVEYVLKNIKGLNSDAITILTVNGVV